MVGLAPKWVRLEPKWDKSGTFSDQISVHLAHRAPDLSNLGSNLTHFGAKSLPSTMPKMIMYMCYTKMCGFAQPGIYVTAVCLFIQGVRIHNVLTEVTLGCQICTEIGQAWHWKGQNYDLFRLVIRKFKLGEPFSNLVSSPHSGHICPRVVLCIHKH